MINLYTASFIAHCSHNRTCPLHVKYWSKAAQFNMAKALLPGR